MVRAGTQGLPLCREGSPWVPAATAASWVLPGPWHPRAGLLGMHPAALAWGRFFAVPCSPPRASLFHPCLFIWVQPLAFPPLPPPLRAPHPTARPGCRAPPAPHHNHPLPAPSGGPPRIPRMAPARRQREEGVGDANLESGLAAGAGAGLVLLRGCRRCDAGAGAGTSLLHRSLLAGEMAAGEAQARRVRAAAPSPAAAGEPEKKRGGRNKNSLGGTLVQAWERGCAGASLSAARGDRRRPSAERRQLMGARRKEGEKGGEREAASLPNTWIPPPVAIWELVISSDA